MSPAEHRKAFIKAFNAIAQHHRRLRVFEDFLELAALAIRKTTLRGEAADKIEAQYMELVGRHEKDDIRKMPELLAIMASALSEPGHDFLGDIAGELELLHKGGGQFFTPWHLSSMMARITLSSADGVERLIGEKGFATLCEPACGAGGMILAFAEVFAECGGVAGTQLFVDATDISRMAFNMTYLQLSLSGIPALVRHGDSLAQQHFDQAFTPPFFPFYAANREAFIAWRHEAPAAAVQDVAATTKPPIGKQAPIVNQIEHRKKPVQTPQLSLFGG